MQVFLVYLNDLDSCTSLGGINIRININSNIN
jgi:hypothetical protein